jgi:hypothetical protein
MSDKWSINQHRNLKSDGPDDPVRRRNAGMDSIHRANRWLVAAALACSAAVSLAAAHAVSGHELAAGAAAVAGNASPAVPTQQSAGSSALQSPSQAPAPAAPAPAVVVSGGS